LNRKFRAAEVMKKIINSWTIMQNIIITKIRAIKV